MFDAVANQRTRPRQRKTLPFSLTRPPCKTDHNADDQSCALSSDGRARSLWRSEGDSSTLSGRATKAVIRAELSRINWRSLRAFAKRRAPTFDPDDLVNTAVVKVLSGERLWDPSKVDFPGFLRGCVRSIASCEAKHARRSRTELHEEIKAATPTVEDEYLRCESEHLLIDRIAIAACGDDALVSYATEADAGSRLMVANELGWTVDQVSAARIKLQRRMRRAA